VTMISSGAEPARTKVVSFPCLVKGSNNNNMMASLAHGEAAIDGAIISYSKSRPETVGMLQGYLMAIDTGYTVEYDVNGGYYKIKASGGDSKFNWSTLEKVKQAFNDRIQMHQIGTDVDGKIFIRIAIE